MHMNWLRQVLNVLLWVKWKESKSSIWKVAFTLINYCKVKLSTIWIFKQLPMNLFTYLSLGNKYLTERELSKFPPRLWENTPIQSGPGADYTCVKMLDTSSQALHKCKLCITVRFQRVTPRAVIVHTTACVSDESLQRGPRRPRRCPRVHGER